MIRLFRWLMIAFGVWDPPTTVFVLVEPMGDYDDAVVDRQAFTYTGAELLSKCASMNRTRFLLVRRNPFDASIVGEVDTFATSGSAASWGKMKDEVKLIIDLEGNEKKLPPAIREVYQVSIRDGVRKLELG